MFGLQKSERIPLICIWMNDQNAQLHLNSFSKTVMLWWIKLEFATMKSEMGNGHVSLFCSTISRFLLKLFEISWMFVLDIG